MDAVGVCRQIKQENVPLVWVVIVYKKGGCTCAVSNTMHTISKAVFASAQLAPNIKHTTCATCTLSS